MPTPADHARRAWSRCFGEDGPTLLPPGVTLQALFEGVVEGVVAEALGGVAGSPPACSQAPTRIAPAPCPGDDPNCPVCWRSNRT